MGLVFVIVWKQNDNLWFLQSTFFPRIDRKDEPFEEDEPGSPEFFFSNFGAHNLLLFDAKYWLVGEVNEAVVMCLFTDMAEKPTPLRPAVI